MTQAVKNFIKFIEAKKENFKKLRDSAAGKHEPQFTYYSEKVRDIEEIQEAPEYIALQSQEDKSEKTCETCLVEPGVVIPADQYHNCLDCGKPITPPQLEPALTMMEDLQSYHNTYDALDMETRAAFRIFSNYIEKHCEVKNAKNPAS